MILAVWSGPRNLSTTLMYSFGSRTDFSIWDEPYYAAYLKKTGLNHPMRKEILETGIQDPKTVQSACISKNGEGRPNLYQKHQKEHYI